MAIVFLHYLNELRENRVTGSMEEEYFPLLIAWQSNLAWWMKIWLWFLISQVINFLTVDNVFNLPQFRFFIWKTRLINVCLKQLLGGLNKSTKYVIRTQSLLDTIKIIFSCQIKYNFCKPIPNSSSSALPSHSPLEKKA